MMKLAQTLQPITPAPQMAPSIPFQPSQPNSSVMQQQLMSSPFDDMKMKRAAVPAAPSLATDASGNLISAPNMYGGQGPANILSDAKGNVGSNAMKSAVPNPNGVTNPLFQTPGMDQIAQLLRGSPSG